MNLGAGLGNHRMARFAYRWAVREVSSKETRREFEEIVGHLAAEDPALARPVRMIPRRVLLTVLAVAGALAWASLSVLMVVWGPAGIVVTCLAVAVTAGWGMYRHRRRNAA
jgi:hypothetical protein